MRFTHTKCGGEIDVEKRQCTRCKKKWDPISFRLDPIGIRPMVDRKGRPVLGGEDIRKLEEKYTKSKAAKVYASWADRIPGASLLAKRLPSWPKWARILSTVAFAVAVASIIYFVVR